MEKNDFLKLLLCSFGFDGEITIKNSHKEEYLNTHYYIEAVRNGIKVKFDDAGNFMQAIAIILHYMSEHKIPLSLWAIGTESGILLDDKKRKEYFCNCKFYEDSIKKGPDSYKEAT